MASKSVSVEGVHCVSLSEWERRSSHYKKIPYDEYDKSTDTIYNVIERTILGDSLYNEMCNPLYASCIIPNYNNYFKKLDSPSTSVEEREKLCTESIDFISMLLTENWQNNIYHNEEFISVISEGGKHKSSNPVNILSMLSAEKEQQQQQEQQQQSSRKGGDLTICIDKLNDQYCLERSDDSNICSTINSNDIKICKNDDIKNEISMTKWLKHNVRYIYTYKYCKNELSLATALALCHHDVVKTSKESNGDIDFRRIRTYECNIKRCIKEFCLKYDILSYVECCDYLNITSVCIKKNILILMYDDENDTFYGDLKQLDAFCLISEKKKKNNYIEISAVHKKYCNVKYCKKLECRKKRYCKNTVIAVIKAPDGIWYPCSKIGICALLKKFLMHVKT